MIEKQLSFRRASPEEEKNVYRFIENQFGSLSLNALEKQILWIREGKLKEVYAVPQKVSELLDKVEHDVYAAGTPLGTFSDTEFLLEIEGAALILPLTKRILHVKTNQFLYGKPIFITNIKNIESDFKKDDFLIITGENNLHYGIGRAKIDSSELDCSKPSCVLISEYKRKPMDRGWYLREEN
ncbi:MAG: hypothetical protein H7645_02570 [Candidatus Heimdallarchaeota archaeon]|nr:hypothetical protein [Candidatus Heimdallarchaeota archaeon]MCK4769200.1 hypothetical protein [Candidatus Heimdallarchaeota archaeon]